MYTYITPFLPQTISKMNKHQIIIFCSVGSNHCQIILPVIKHTINTKLTLMQEINKIMLRETNIKD